MKTILTNLGVSLVAIAFLVWLAVSALRGLQPVLNLLK